MGVAKLICRIVYGLCLLAVGAGLAYGGVKLIALGGSFYYLPAGLATVITGLTVLVGRWRLAGWTFLVLMAVTLIWGLGESGLDGWALMPRLLSPFVLGLPLLVIALTRGKGMQRKAGLATAAVALILVGTIWATSGYDPVKAEPREAVAFAEDAGDDWVNFGGTKQGRHFSTLAQIDRGNAGQLEQVWSVKTGPFPTFPMGQNQSQHLKVDNDLYMCTSLSDVINLDPETGKTKWKFDAKSDVSGMFTTKCRGVTYYQVSEGDEACAAQVYTAASDGRLIALDAKTGKLCETFGEGGIVDLTRHIEQRNTGYYRITSPPTLVRGKLVVNAAISDGQHTGEPSGVIRAYDAVTGKLAWAWDLDRPGERGEPADGEVYSPGTPNSWGPTSADEELGLVYIPTGNATPDYWGGHRTAESNKYASSIVALDAETGDVRWHFQTVHYDVWDYDIASQPVLFELRKDGKTFPALLQPTKRGQTFVLDRRNGEELFPIEERPAPQEGAVEKLPPTQPWSPAMHNLGGPLLTESKMWGVSALDQLWCRIKFKAARYDGEFTPPGLTPSIQDPGYTGGTNWGSFSVDTSRQLGFTLSNRFVTHVQLRTRDDPKAKDLKASSTAFAGGLVAQEGTPYAADITFFVSPLGVPCQQPPHGLINAIDLSTGELLWSRPLGTARDTGPMMTPSHLPFTIGTMTFGGTMSTAGGLVFAGGSQDHSFRAFDSETGTMLFEADLPGSAATRPMTFLSGKDGRQYVVVSSESPTKGGKAYGAVTAFALPKKE
ncbi:MAG: PQQ-binding-like beta-propeller repeat protein [Novosphingobium sp.]|nr:PQQ-binding-like beta-propeller repeat protein [Novosphingobium sp.]